MNFIEFLIAQAKFSGLSGGVQGDIKPLRVIENGTFEAPDGTAGYNPVVVNVLDPETGSPLKFTSGSFRPTADRTRMTIEHGLGCMPDFVMVYAVGFPSGFDTGDEFVDAKPIVSAWGFKSCFDVKCLSYLGWPSAGWSYNQYGIDNTSETGRENGMIYCPDESTFQVGYHGGGTGTVGLSSGIQYDWIAVAGLGTVSESVIEPLTITENGTYNAPEGVDGYNPVVVNVAGGSSADVRYVTFKNHDGTVEYGKKPVAIGDDCADPIARGIFATPTRESDVQYNYTFYGWATEPNGAADADWYKAITADKTVYANFTATVRHYTITYYDSDGTTVLKTESLAYGTMPSYAPTKDGYDFKNWNPTPVAVNGDSSYTAYWEALVGFAVATWEEIAQAVSDGSYTNKYSLNNKRVDTIIHSDGTTETVEFEIVDMDSGSVVSGTSMALLATHVLDEPQYYDTSTYDDMNYYLYCSLTVQYLKNLADLLPEDMKSAIKTVKLDSFSNKLHVANMEVLTGNRYINTIGYFEKFDKFKTSSSLICKKRDGTAVDWWLRNTHTEEIGSEVRYPYFVNASGVVAYDSSRVKKYVRLLLFV